ncbi:MAG: GNAT family N-acetyltransferase [Myxococcales bacterium]|nr:GNAT family N-acetyltransferase [Myxococcales bacterium]
MAQDPESTGVLGVVTLPAPSAGLRIRRAQTGDGAVVLALIAELAEYERLLDHVTATREDIERLLFTPDARAFCELAEWDGVPVGFAFWFYNASTFRGRLGIYLEDLYVQPSLRGKGIGKALLAALARQAVAEDLPRLDWVVLGWNTPAIAFFESFGATSLSAWTGFRLTGSSLADLARQAPAAARC